MNSMDCYQYCLFFSFATGELKSKSRYWPHPRPAFHTFFSFSIQRFAQMRTVKGQQKQSIHCFPKMQPSCVPSLSPCCAWRRERGWSSLYLYLSPSMLLCIQRRKWSACILVCNFPPWKRTGRRNELLKRLFVLVREIIFLFLFIIYF